MDADEELAEGNRGELYNQSLFEDCDAFSLPLINYFGEEVNLDEYAQIAQPRMFRNDKGFRFENKIHEWLNISSAYEKGR